MSAKDLIERLASDRGTPLDWRQIREEIHNEHAQAVTVEDRAVLLAAHQALMDAVERQLPTNADIEQFRATRLKDYNLLIVRECLIGDGICTETLFAVTQREIKAGRMDSNHSLAQGAVEAIAAPHYSREELLAQEAKRLAENRKPAWRRALSRVFGE
jgi:hypothetical protein